MKTRLLIIIGITLIFGVIVIIDISQNQLEWNKVMQEDIHNPLQNVLDYCNDKALGREVTADLTLSFENGTHYINNNSCEWKERGFVSTTPFGYPRDTAGNYDHCFSYKTDPEYGVEIQNSTHILNLENCEWELENEH